MENALAKLLSEPPDQFLATRAALAKELEKAGDAEQARAIQKVRKPSLSVWAVNQLAHSPKEVGKLLEAGRALQKAFAALMGGHADPDAVREAQTAEQDAVTDLVERAGKRLEAIGHPASEQVRSRIEGTLRAVARGSKEVQDAFSEGTLLEDLQPEVTFGVAGAAATPSARPAKHSEKQRAKQEEAEARERARQLEALRAAEHEAKEARSHALALEKEAFAAEADAREKRKLADEASAAAEKLEEKVKALKG